jgi:hypothetical protein
MSCYDTNPNPMPQCSSWRLVYRWDPILFICVSKRKITSQFHHSGLLQTVA